MDCIITGIKLNLKEFLFIIDENELNFQFHYFLQNEYDDILEKECKHCKNIFLEFIEDFKNNIEYRNFYYYFQDFKYLDLKLILSKLLFNDVINFIIVNTNILHRKGIIVIGDIMKFSKGIHELNIQPINIQFIDDYNNELLNLKSNLIFTKDVKNIIIKYIKLDISHYQIKNYFYSNGNYGII